MPADAALLEEIRERRKYASDESRDIREEARKDMLCVAGYPWEAMDPEGARQRDATNRPMLALDELGQYHNQVINDLRANPIGMAFAPAGNGASEKGAEFYQKKAREIEYRSNATIAYITAAENAIQRSYGWLRISTRYENDRSFNQDLEINPVVNPDAMLADPDVIWPDSRDMKYAFYLESRTIAEMRREFKDKTSVDALKSAFVSDAPQWSSGDQVTLAEYWTKESQKEKLLAVMLAGQSQPLNIFAKDLSTLPAGARVARSREVDTTRVVQYLTNGLEVLKKTAWAGKHIPFVSCLGKVLYVDRGAGAKRHILSMTRLARDPYMLYCYYRSCEAELVGMTPKFPYFVYEGQMSPEELENLAKSLHEPIAVIKVRPIVEGVPSPGPLGFPQRQPYEPPLQGLELGAEGARRAIQAAMGISPLPTLAQRNNEKSGKALQQIRNSGQTGSFHFRDHYMGMVQRTGVIIEDLISPILDSARDVTVRNGDADQTSSIIRINDPTHPDSVSTQGDYQVTVSTGPATDSQHEAASDFVDTLVANLKMIADIAGPHVAAQVLAKNIKLKQLGPIGNEIADLLNPTPPGQDGKPIPPAVAKLMAENKQLQGMLQQAAQEKQGKLLDLQWKFKIEQMKEDAATTRAAADREVKLAVAEEQAKTERDALFLEESRLVGIRAVDHAEHRRSLAHDAVERAKDRIHEHVQGAVEHAQALDLADQQAAQQAGLAAQQPDAGGNGNGAAA